MREGYRLAEYMLRDYVDQPRGLQAIAAQFATAWTDLSQGVSRGLARFQTR